MKLFLDTANIDAIKQFAAWGVIDGVTTNPSLVAKEGGIDFEDAIMTITKLVDGPISAEVIATDTEGMLKEGREYAKWHKNIHVKIPCTPAGIAACKKFSKEGIKTNVTLVFSATQALLAAKAGATLMSPFVGRLDDIDEDGMALIADIVQLYENYDFDTQILVASVRSPEHVAKAAVLGADIATVPPAIMEKMIQHPLTDKGLEKFLADWKKSN